MNDKIKARPTGAWHFSQHNIIFLQDLGCQNFEEVKKPKTRERESQRLVFQGKTMRMHPPLHLQFPLFLILAQTLFPSIATSSTSGQQIHASVASGVSPPIYRKNIIVEDYIAGEISIREGEEPVDIVHAFVTEHDLDYSHKDSILTDACSKVHCARTRALLFQSPVLSEDGSLIGNVEIFEDEEPADVAFEFSTSHNLTKGYFTAILRDACENIECTRIEPIIFRLSVDLGEEEESVLLILEDEDPIEVVHDFCVEHDLDAGGMKALLAEVEKSPLLEVDWDSVQSFLSQADEEQTYDENEAGELIHSISVEDESGAPIGNVEFYSAQEPADVVYDFAKLHELNEDYIDAILIEACEHIECTRTQPIIYALAVNLGGAKSATLEVLQDENPVDAIHNFCQMYGIDDQGKDTLIEEASKSPLLSFSREPVVLWNQEVQLENDISLGKVQIFEGDEPVDAIHNFLVDKDLDANQMKHVQNVLLAHACEVIFCRRKKALMWSEVVETEEGEFIGEVEVLEGDEPVDAIDAFVKGFNLHVDYRWSILGVCCEVLVCTRDLPAVFSHNVNNEHGELMGTLVILEGEEVVDAVVKFVIDYHANVDMIAFKNYFFEHACGTPSVLCTRNVAVLYDKEVIDEERKSLGRLQITEGREPVDQIWTLLSDAIEDENMRMNFFFNLRPSVCDGNKYVVCHRKAPIMFGPQSISGPDGENVGHLEIMLGEEPVDATYKFFAKNGLFKKNWDFKAVFKQICSLEGVKGKCLRQEAIKYHEEDAEVDGIKIGRLIVWEHEEVIDVLYQKRLEFGLTVAQQMGLFNKICQMDEVHCERSRAVVWKQSVNKLDYPDWNNFTYTCVRKYAGWRHLSGWNEIGIGFNETALGSFKGIANPIIKRFREDDGMVMFRPFKRVIGFLIEEGGAGEKFINDFVMDSRFVLALFFGFYLFARLSTILIFYVPFIRRWKDESPSLTKWSHLLLIASAFVNCSRVYVSYIEPNSKIDSAWYAFKGKVPDLEIKEGMEVADAVWDWAKSSEKTHHPLLRKPVHTGLISEICKKQVHLSRFCNRKKAYLVIDMGAITLFGMEHKIKYWKNPNATMEEEVEAGIVDSAAMEICDRLVPMPPNCYADISVHMKKQYSVYEEKRLDKKDLYVRLGVVSDASSTEIWHAAARVMKNFGENVVPFARVDNGTKVYHPWSEQVIRASNIRDKLDELLDEKDREWYDKPCEPVFGGAMCAKKDAKGNMMIEMGGGDE